jgi:hypothetical protein
MKTLKDILLEKISISRNKLPLAPNIICCTEEEILNGELRIEEIDKFNQPFLLKHEGNIKREYTYFYLLLNDNIIGIIEYNNYYCWLNLIVPLKTYKNLTGLYDYPQNEEDYIEVDRNIKRCILMLDERFENKQVIGLTIPEIFYKDKNQYLSKSSLTTEYIELLDYIKTILE